MCTNLKYMITDARKQNAVEWQKAAGNSIRIQCNLTELLFISNELFAVDDDVVLVIVW